jgi:hypothetical protein
MSYCLVIDNSVARGPCGLPGRVRLPDGSTRTDLAALSAADLRALGWWPCVETRPDLAEPTEDYGQPELTVDAEAGTVSAVYPVVTVPDPALAVPLSKLALRRALRARGLEPTLKALLKADQMAANDWADAVTLRLDDPVFAKMLPAFKAQAGMTDAQIAELVDAARA